MDIFRTPVDAEVSKHQAGYHAPLVFMGSCFSENIGNKLNELRLPVCLNPFGILYNPVSICQSLEYLLKGKVYKESDLGFHNGLWFSFDHHGRFSAIEQADCLNRINESVETGHQFLKKASHLFITLGTAWVYQLRTSGKIVANCHKIPDSSFERRILQIDEICRSFGTMLKNLKKFNPDLQVVFSLSPVRHTRDGAIGNAHSKATLLVAIHRIIADNPGAAYFPAWEILMDDLRDYRFYEPDMLHPNSQAIEYIHDRFAHTWLTSETREIMKGMERIVLARKHRPVNPDTEDFRRFILSALAETHKMQEKYPKIDLSDDLNFFSRILE
ncbi:MAG: GSCFA domain-containing protein [Bacteroidales bacterium]